MPTFREVCDQAAPLLLLDAASTRVQIAVLRPGLQAAWAVESADAGVAVFSCVARLGLEIGDVEGFVFCEGPGSILGIRSVATAIRTWNVLRPRPVWAYQSLALVAAAVRDPELAVIADARRDSWHLARLGAPLMRCPAPHLPPGPLGTPEGFRQWGRIEGRTPPRVLSYDLADLLPRVADDDLLVPASAPDAFLHEEPAYVTWSPQIHRAQSP